MEAAALHFSVIAVKPSFLLGVGTWAGAFAADCLARSRPELRIPVVFVACSVIFLLRLPWAQTFYVRPAFPDLHLYGYQWVGARSWGGRPSLGARSRVPVPTDGAEQALRWVHQRAGTGDTVVTLVRPRHSVEATAPDRAYRLIDGLEDPGAVSRADFVVTTLGAEIRHCYGAENPDAVFALPYDPARLRSGFTRVYSVKRAFDLEFASVWRRDASRER